MGTEIELIINGEKIAMNKFVNDIFKDVVLAFLNNLSGIELTEINRVEIS